MKHVYVIGPENGPFKIGIAKDVQKRVAELQTGCPFPIIVHHIETPENALKSEQSAHARLSSARTSGEWFDVDLEDAIDAVNGVDLVPPPPTATNFERWMFDMKSAGLARSDAECARLLGLSANIIVKMKRRGCDRRTALACRALLHRLEPYA